MGLHMAGVILFLLLVCNPAINGIAISKEDYPNPKTEPKRCNRAEHSYICDPDGVLPEKQADKLDRFAAEMASSTKCLCPECVRTMPGVSIRILMKHNLTNQGNILAASEVKAVAELVRKRWHLGSCEDDILILLITQTSQAEYDMGLPVEEALTKRLARQIFNDCIGHFENNHFYQGLESMINSYRDALQKNHVTNPKVVSSRTGLIVGLSLGIAVLVFILMAAAFFRYRQVKKLKSSQSKRYRKASFERSADIEGAEFQFHLYNGQYKMADPCISSDEGIDSDEEGMTFHEMSRLHVPKFTDSFRRQLSDVVEENEEEIAAIKLAMVNSPKNSRTHITEL